jgi:hypothetical protein
MTAPAGAGHTGVILLLQLLWHQPLRQTIFPRQRIRYEGARWPNWPRKALPVFKDMSTMRFRLALLALSAAALSACTTAGVPSNPLEARWNGKSAGAFFAAYGPPVSDTAGAGGTSTYIWRGGFSRGKSCLVELSVGKDYQIKRIKALSDRPGTNGGPSHCEQTLDAA